MDDVHDQRREIDATAVRKANAHEELRAIPDLLCASSFRWRFQRDLQHPTTSYNNVHFLDPFDRWMANKASPIHVLIVELMVETRD